MINSTPINGHEINADKGSPYAALVQFYHAFNQADMTLMSQNWWPDEQASMSNPLGGIKRGWNEISDVYKRIFNGPAQVYVEFYDYSIHQTDNMFCAVGRERGFFKQGDTEIELAIRTSRTYTLKDDLWRQLHHHGSIDKAELLKAYQQAVLHH